MLTSKGTTPRNKEAAAIRLADLIKKGIFLEPEQLDWIIVRYNQWHGESDCKDLTGTANKLILEIFSTNAYLLTEEQYVDLGVAFFNMLRGDFTEEEKELVKRIEKNVRSWE
ncbi:MAG: hypothetical protein ACXAEU_05300 [Candidatus Hodarchaeales archaeon]